MNYQAIIDKYYPEENELKHILMVHSRKVADKALAIVDNHPELHADRQFVEEAAMLHDIGIFRCDAAGIQCFGTEPYLITRNVTKREVITMMYFILWQSKTSRFEPAIP